MRIQIQQLFFSMRIRIRIQLNKIGQILPYIVLKKTKRVIHIQEGKLMLIHADPDPQPWSKGRMLCYSATKVIVILFRYSFFDMYSLYKQCTVPFTTTIVMTWTIVWQKMCCLSQFLFIVLRYTLLRRQSKDCRVPSSVLYILNIDYILQG